MQYMSWKSEDRVETYRNPVPVSVEVKYLHGVIVVRESFPTLTIDSRKAAKADYKQGNCLHRCSRVFVSVL